MPACLLRPTRDPTGGLLRRTFLSPVLVGSQSINPAGSRPCCLGAVPLEVTSVTTSVTGPIGTCVDDGGWFYLLPSAVTGSVPGLLAARANKSSAGAGMVKAALVAQGKVSPVLPLGCHDVDRYSSVGSVGLLPLGLSLRCYLPVVIVVIVVIVAVAAVVVVVAVVAVVVVPEFPLVVVVVDVGAGFGFRGHRPLSNRLISHADGDTLDAFIRQWIEGGYRILNLGS